MVVDFSIFTNSVEVHPRVKKYFHKWNQLGEDQPNINHLDVSSRRKALRHTDKQSGQDQEGREVDGNNRLKKEILEEVCCVDDDQDENCWEINC